MKVNPPGDTPSPKRFETTHWSVVLSCAQKGSKDESERALAALCHAYWRPVFDLICRRGHSVADAQDLTQDFFLMLFRGNLLSLADPTRGRFRSLLRTALENFLTDKQYLAHRQKRGGAIQFVPWEEWIAETPAQISIYEQESKICSAERVFDVRWAQTIVERAMGRLAKECEARGRLGIFTSLSKYLLSDRMEISYADLATSAGVPERMIKRLLHEFRVRYRGILREEVARTVSNPADVDDEVHYLCAALASAE